MLLIVANRQDQAAAHLAARWAAHDACLLTPADLSSAGWRYSLPAGRSHGVAGGRGFESDEIKGVLTRLSRVDEQDLPHIVEPDRRYVAAEMAAFLASWLSHLGCPVLNRPTPECLAGRSLRTEQWLLLAARLGLRVRAVGRQVRRGMVDLVPPWSLDPPSLTTVEVVGGAIAGHAEPALATAALRLASAAGLNLLSVRFDGPEADAAFVDAHLWPDVTADAVADALLAQLQRGAPC
jgi:hypothetical protein